MDKFYFEFENGDIPKYLQIVLHIKELVDSEKLEDGEKLPTIRELAKLLNVNNDTVISAYKALQSEGYAIQKIGSGTYVKKKEINKSFNKKYSEIYRNFSSEEGENYIDFGGENTSSEFFPVSSLKHILNDVIDRDGADAFTYQESLGYRGLRKSISKFFWDDNISEDDVLIVSGAQQGIDIVSKAILNVNDNVLVEKPTYNGALSVFKWRRCNVIEVPIEEDGIDIKALEKILKKNKIKCFYTMSYFQNPTTVSCSYEKKKELIRLAQAYDFYIIEDDYLSELIYNPDLSYESLKSMDLYDRVIYIKSFSKIFLPGIRIGYVIPPIKLRENLQNSKVNTDISTSSLMQRALDLYINENLWQEHILKLNSIYKSRYIKFKNYIDSILGNKVQYTAPGGGLNFYLKISDNIGINSIELFNSCLKSKLLISPGVLFYKNPEDGLKYFRISFSRTNNLEIKKGVIIINDVLNCCKN